MDRSDLRTVRFPWQPAALFAVTAGVVLFYALGSFRTFTTHEGYAAVPARTMMETGNWIVPDFGGLPRLRKPPLCYWTLATLGTICGGLDEFTARLPSALAALFLAVLMGVWAKRWYGGTAGWAAAFVQLTTVYVVNYSRKAEVDMVLWLMIAAALYLVANEPADEPARRNRVRWLAVSFLIGVSFLAKFHYGPAMIIAPVILYLLIQGRRWDVAKLCDPLGVLLIGAAALLWPSLVLRDVPNAAAIWYGETIGRAEGNKGSHGFFFYVPVLLVYFLPWTPFVFASVRSSWRQAWREGVARERFLWIWFCTQFLICSIQPSKHTHYIFVAFPVFTMLAARRIAAWVEAARNGERLVSRRWATVLSVGSFAALIAVAIVARRHWPEIATPVWVACTIAGTGIAIGLWAAVRRRFRPVVMAGAAVYLGAFIVLHGWILPRQDHRRAAMLFADDVRETVGTRTPVYTHGLGQHPVAFYLHDPVRRAESIDAVNALLEHNEKVYVLTMGWRRPNVNRVPNQKIIRTMPTPPGIADPHHAPLILIEIESPRSVARRRRETQLAGTAAARQ